MAWNNAGEIPVGSDGQVYLGDANTARPSAHDTSLDAATWVGLGFLSEDGFTKNDEVDIANIPAWQSQDPVRREVTGRTTRFTFALMQWNEETLVAAFGGGTVEAAGSGYVYTPPDSNDALAEHAIVIDAVDGSDVYRFWAPRVTIVEGVETTFKRGEPALLPVTFECLTPETGGPPYQVLSNQAGMASGS